MADDLRSFVARARRSKFFGDSLAYSGTNLAEQLLSFMRSFVLRRILPPEVMGFWNYMLVIQGTLGTFDLGIISGATRELPLIGTTGEAGEDRRRICSTTLWFTLLQNGILTMLAGVYVFVYRNGESDGQFYAALGGIAIFFIASVHTVYSTFLVTAQEFVRLSRLSVACAIVDCLGFIAGAWAWGIGGLLFSSLACAAFRGALFVWAARSAAIQTRTEISFPVLTRLLSFGFFLRVVDYPSAISGMASLLWVTKFMDVGALALFAMAKGFSSQVADMSTKAGAVYTMRFLEQIGNGTSRDVIGRQMKQYLMFQLVVVVPVLCWLAFAGLTFIVDRFIPKYSGANECFLILLISCFFYVLNSGLTNPWMAEKRLLERGIANLVGLAAIIGALLVSWFGLGGRSIVGVSYASLAGSLLYFAYMVIAVGRDYWSLGERIDILCMAVSAAVWTFGALYAGWWLFGGATGGPRTSVLAALSMGMWTLLALFPLIYVGIKKSRVLGGWAR